MKKLISILAAALFVLLICVPASAAEVLSEVTDDTDISVFAKYTDNTGFIVIPTDSEGNGSVTLPDETQIAVSHADNAKGRLFVEEVTDKDALDWIAEQLGGKASDTKTYHVYMLDANGVAIPTEGVKISVMPKDFSADSVYAVADGKTGKLQSAVENGKITFTTNSTYLYTLCSDSGNASPHQTSFPFWVIPIIVIGCATPFVVIFIKKREHPES